MQPDQPRITILSWLIWALLAAGLIGCVFWASPASAETYSAKDSEGNIVTLTDKPCDGLLPWIRMWQALMRYRGKDYKACWFPVSEVVIVFDDNGDVTPIEKERFNKDEAL